MLIVCVLTAFDRHNTESIFTLLCLMLVRLMLCFDQYYQQCNMGMQSQTSQMTDLHFHYRYSQSRLRWHSQLTVTEQTSLAIPLPHLHGR